jgi:hypothetical protein
MDRTDAIRLLESLVAAGMNTRAPKANAWIEKKALQIGLEGNQFVSALAYVGNEGWLADAPRKGWTSLTRAGEAIARRSAPLAGSIDDPKAMSIARAALCTV